MAYRHNRKTGGLFRVEGTPYSEPAMAIQRKRFPGQKQFEEMLADTGMDQDPEEVKYYGNIDEFFSSNPKTYEDVTFDFWHNETGWHGVSSSQEAPTVNFQSRPTVARYIKVYRREGIGHGYEVEE